MQDKYHIKEDLGYALSIEELTIDDISYLSNVSKRTLVNIFKSGYYPSEDIIDKLYCFLNKYGFDFSKDKEEFFKDAYPLVLFHGSKSGIQNLTFNGSRNYCDFGSGFYLSESLLNAQRFVFDFPSSSVYAYCLDIADLNVCRLTCSREWLLAICYFRGYLKLTPKLEKIIEPILSADVIIAPIADSQMFRIIKFYVDGFIDEEEAIANLLEADIGLQYVIKSQKSLEQLKLLEHLFFSTYEKDQIRGDSLERKKQVDEIFKSNKKKHSKKFIEDNL